MKKISIILSLSLVLFLTACEESKYNFSSVEELNASIEKQTEKEGVSKKDLNSLMHELTVNEQEEFLLKLIKKDIKNKTIGKMKAEFEKNGFVSEEAKKNRNMVVDTSNKILFMNLMSSGKLIMVGAYNFSSEKAFLESLKKRAKIENVPEDEAEDILREYLSSIYKANEDSIGQKKDVSLKSIFIHKLLKENIGNKSIREIEAQIDKM